MKTAALVLTIAAGLLTLPGSLGAAAEDSSVFAEVWTHYEAIRLALLTDSMDGLAAEATRLAERSGKLLDQLDGSSDGVVEALTQVQAAATGLAEAADLESAREGLFLLTRPMTRLRQLTGSESTVVAYCSMAGKAWIQPEGELGNPYMGQRMPRCGEVVGES